MRIFHQESVTHLHPTRGSSRASGLASPAQAECARRQQIAARGLIGGPIAFVASMALFVYSAIGPAGQHELWGDLGTMFLLIALGLLVWGSHYMDCTDKGEPPTEE